MAYYFQYCQPSQAEYPYFYVLLFPIVSFVLPPPGYFSFIIPPAFSVRQYGVIFFLPSATSSSAAPAAIQAKIPVVIGQLIVAQCFRASLSRIWFMVISLPRELFSEIHQLLLCWNDYSACSPSFAHFASNLYDLWQAFVVFEFFSPRFATHLIHLSTSLCFY